MPRYPNFDEADLSDKPAIQAFFPDPLTGRRDRVAHGALARAHGRRCSASTTSSSASSGVLKRRRAPTADTVIVFTSDNGWILGEHRLKDPVSFDGRATGVKYLPFEGSSRVPLIIAGPDFPRDRTVRGVATNADLAPTILDLAGAKATLPQDGVSLLQGRAAPVAPRRAAAC